MKNKEVIKCVDSVYFLGRTNNYVFILYPNSNGDYSKTRVINSSDIEEINILNIVKWYQVIP
jgi:hypothetical protein